MHPSERLLARLRTVSNATQAAKEHALIDSGLTKAQYNALVMIGAREATTSSQAARACQVTQQAMSVTTQSLVSGGFLMNENSPHGGRSRVLRITARGASALALADARVRALDAQLRAAVDPRDLDVTMAALTLIEKCAVSYLEMDCSE